MDIQVIISWNLCEVSSHGFHGDSDKLTQLAMKLDDAIIRELPKAFVGSICESGHGDYDTYAVVRGGRETSYVVLSAWGDSDGGDLNVYGTVTSDEIEQLLTDIYNLDKNEYDEPAMMFRICMDRVDIDGKRYDPLQGDKDEFIKDFYDTLAKEAQSE